MQAMHQYRRQPEGRSLRAMQQQHQQGPRRAALTRRQAAATREPQATSSSASSVSSSSPDAMQASTSGSDHAAAPVLQGKLARFAARKQQGQPVREAQRPLADYMALPASQYSVLDARKIERIDDSTFRCYVGRLAFFGFSVEPVITVSVVVEERGCTIKLLSARLQGSAAVEEVNSRFTATMTNVVRWAPTQEPDVKAISSDTLIEVVVQVPGWAGLVPVGSIEAAGSRVMQTTLNLMVPRFLEQLDKDYHRWAAGDESRSPLDEGGL